MSAAAFLGIVGAMAGRPAASLARTGDQARPEGGTASTIDPGLGERAGSDFTQWDPPIPGGMPGVVPNEPVPDTTSDGS